MRADQGQGAYELHPAPFLHERLDRLTERGLQVGGSSLSLLFNRHGITRKYSGYAAEPEREDMTAARLSWFERPLDIAQDRLLFLDETAANMKVASRYGRAPHGERCRVAAPFGHQNTVTAGLTATALFDGPMTGACFRDDVGQTLVPAPRPGDTVGLDNPPGHKVGGIRKPVAAAGPRLHSLPV